MISVSFAERRDVSRLRSDTTPIGRSAGIDDVGVLAAVPLEIVVLGGEAAQHRADRVGRGEGEGLGDHQAAGGVVVVFHETAHVGGVLGLHLREDRLGVFVVELADDVGLHVGVRARR